MELSLKQNVFQTKSVVQNARKSLTPFMGLDTNETPMDLTMMSAEEVNNDTTMLNASEIHFFPDIKCQTL